MSYVVKKRFLLLLGIMICTSRLAAMDDAAVVCPFCCEPNFEISARLYINASTGEDFSPSEHGNAHIECLRSNGLLRKTPESELIRNAFRTSMFIAGCKIGAGMIQLVAPCADSDNFLEIVVWVQTISLFIPLGIYASHTLPSVRHRIKDYFSKLFTTSATIPK
ncbi:MAG: hypothetical protein V1646_03630 [bacterium]